MEKTSVTLEFQTNTPAHVDRVLFEAIRSSVRNGAQDMDLEILSALMVASIKAENERYSDGDRKFRDDRETDTIRHAVRAGSKGEIDAADAKHLGTLRTGKIDAARPLVRDAPEERARPPSCTQRDQALDANLGVYRQ